MTQITVKVDYGFMMEIFGRNITTGTCVCKPVHFLPPITPMVGFRIVMPAYRRQRTHKFALVVHDIVICQHVCIEF